MFTFVFVSAVGLVTAGLVRNLWPLFAGDQVSLSLLEERGVSLPLRAMVLVLSAPVLLIGATIVQAGQSPDKIVKWWMTLPTAMGWSFAQGVVVVVALSSIG